MWKKTRILIVVFISVITGVVCGYYFKKPDSTMLNNALGKSTEWKKELYIEALRSKTPLFQLETINTYTGSNGELNYSWSGDFIFNWLALAISSISMIIILFLLIKIDFTKVFSKIKPFLK